MRTTVLNWILNALLFICATGFATAQSQFNVLYTFGSGGTSDGSLPSGKLVMDAAGNLYGTTESGGENDDGTVFELSPGTGGTWTETVLYSFCSQVQCADGQQPMAGLIIDEQGNLYGTTMLGGHKDNICCWGVVFELSPPAPPGSAWAETVLWTFGGTQQSDGLYPRAKLTFDANGNLYGTTSGGGAGAHAGGTVFELMPSGDGTWNESLLYTFECERVGGGCFNGSQPYAGVTFDKGGNLYGTTLFGGGKFEGAGVVYELSPGQNGWTQSVLYNFTSSGSTHGNGPMSAIAIDAQGNLYGTVTGSEPSTFGGAFRLTPANGGKQTFLPFEEFDGIHPEAGVLIDPRNGNLYGTAPTGGSTGFGTVYKIAGKKVTALYTFTGGADGGNPEAALIADKKANLYGVARQGGAFNHGVVFQITP
jgi:uncharacterized repeat protein (TIGR03803 family)